MRYGAGNVRKDRPNDLVLSTLALCDISNSK